MEKLWPSCRERLTFILKDQRGSVLVFSLFILIMLGVWGVTSLTLNTNEYFISHSSIEAAQAYYLAEAGLEEAIIKIKKEPDHMENFTATIPTGNYTVSYTKDENNIIKITSQGEAKEAEKTLNAKLKIIPVATESEKSESKKIKDKELESENPNAENTEVEIRLIDWW